MSAWVRIAGIDEVGRGCLAGPVCAAAVVLPHHHRLDGLRDSKKLSAAQRERLAPQIRSRALAWAIGWASVEEIDALNILQATFLAMRRAVDGLGCSVALSRVDGSQRPPLPGEVETHIGGDDRIDSIMAAAIVAKVARDALLADLDQHHPGYGLGRHKGYGTAEHLDALGRLGPSAIHRRSFAPCAAQRYGPRQPPVGAALPIAALASQSP